MDSVHYLISKHFVVVEIFTAKINQGLLLIENVQDLLLEWTRNALLVKLINVTHNSNNCNLMRDICDISFINMYDLDMYL
jgi:hypothetical protein